MTWQTVEESAARCLGLPVNRMRLLIFFEAQPGRGEDRAHQQRRACNQDEEDEREKHSKPPADVSFPQMTSQHAASDRVQLTFNDSFTATCWIVISFLDDLDLQKPCFPETEQVCTGGGIPDFPASYTKSWERWQWR
jgi:hypothetical protein